MDASRRGLQILLGLMGLVMVVAGTATVLLGATSVPDEGSYTPDIDSEMRFYAVWYVAAGVATLRAATKPEYAYLTIRLVGVAFFVAGSSRVLSWIVVGRPNTFAIVLMVIELLLPFVVIPWQSNVMRRARPELSELSEPRSH